MLLTVRVFLECLSLRHGNSGTYMFAGEGGCGYGPPTRANGNFDLECWAYGMNPTDYEYEEAELYGASDGMLT